MCTLMLFPFLCCARSSSISHITLAPVSPQPSLRSFITVSVKRWLGSQECHANVAPLCMSAHSCVLVCLLVCLCPFTHVFFYFLWGGGACFLCLFFVLYFPFPSKGAGDMKVCRCSDRASRQRGSQEELSSSNRQRAKRMTVPSSSLSVNMIMFEPSLGSKACRTACKTVTKESQTETHWRWQSQASFVLTL